MKSLHENLDALRFYEQFGSFDSVLLEMTAEEAESIRPKDGVWTSGNRYDFNVEGDDGSDCYMGNSQPIYSVTFGSGGDEITSPVSIAFFRCGGIKDVGKGFQKPVFDAVQKAIYEYIKKNNPASLSWTPVGKSKRDPDAKVKNPEARKYVYDLLSKRSLFPQKYVSLNIDQWIRRDLYDKYLVPQGFPPITLTDKSSLKEKNTELEKLRNAARQDSDTFGKIYQAANQHREFMQQEYQEKLNSAMTDPEKNPQGLKVGDKVEFKIEENDFLAGKKSAEWLRNIHWSAFRPDQGIIYKYGIIQDDKSLQNSEHRRRSGENSFLIVKVKFFEDYLTNDSILYDFPIVDLYKINNFEERKQQQIDKTNEEIADPDNNPKQIKIGDKLILGDLNNPPSYDSPSQLAKLFGIVGEVKNIKKIRTYYGYSFNAEIAINKDDCLTKKAKEVADIRSSLNIDIKSNEEHINLYNAENVAKVKEHDRRQTDLQTVSSQRRRFERAAQRDEEMRRIQAAATTPEIQRLIDAPENPEKIKPGDRIKIKTNEETSQEGLGWLNSRLAGRDAVVTNLQINWRGSIQVYFKIVRSTIESNLQINYVKKVVDETVLARHSRAAARAEVRQRIASGEATGGRNIGDRTTVTSGPHRGKSGIIMGWRQTGQYLYAKIRTFETEGHPVEEIQVNVTNLSPVSPQGVSENVQRFIRLLSICESLQYRRRKS